MFSKGLAAVKEWSGVLALFLVLSGGVAYAVDTVGSADVIDNSLLSADLKDNKAVKTADVQDHTLSGVDIASNSVGGSRITDGTITGADVDATTLNAGGDVSGALSNLQIGNGTVGRSELASGAPQGCCVFSDFAYDVPAHGCHIKRLAFSEANLGEIYIAFPESADLGTGVYLRPTVVAHPGEAIFEICNDTDSTVTIPFGTFFQERLIG